MTHHNTTITLAILAIASLAAVAGAQINPIGTRPQGSLTGKIVYVHAGHGYTADNLNGGAFSFQRGELFELIEDLSNQDMMTYLVDYLWNAGATIVPLRPIDHQPNEIVIDNDDTEVTFTGTWSNSNSPIFFGSPGDVPYRFATAGPAQTATARYTPTFAQPDVYPVYAWTRYGSDRVNQLYRVTHSGGTTDVTVDHTKVGNGLVFLGTYHFDAGNDGHVEISNLSTDNGVVIADMIRFGNGMGDINRGAGVSGVPREDEPALYWIEKHAGQGIPSTEWRTSSSDRTATVSASPRWAEQMNREAAGTLADRVFVSYHSNAGGSRGTLGLYNGNNDPNTATPNQFLLANGLSAEINDDMVALDGNFEHNWFDRTTHALDRSDIEFGEINNNVINDEFDATIVEWAFHDDQADTELMRDPNVRNAVARATYQGVAMYFNVIDGGPISSTLLPEPVTNLRAVSLAPGTVTLFWTTPVNDGIGGTTPAGYRVYTSLNGRGFDGGTTVNSAATTVTTIAGLDPAQGTHYFRVTANNAAGESLNSAVVAATPKTTNTDILIVNGFDRLDRNGVPRKVLPGGRVVDRIRPRFQNSRDYAVQVAAAVEAFNPDLQLQTAENDSVISGDIQLTDYNAVIWILGEESSADDTFDNTEQSLVSSYINAGGNFIVSGAEIGWDLDFLNNGRAFFNGTLRSDYAADDAGTYNVAGAPATEFDGITVTFDDGDEFYDTQFPDVLNPFGGGAQTVMTYSGGSGGGAAIHSAGTGNVGDVVVLGFPFETIIGESNRANVMAAILATLCNSDAALCPCICERDGSGTTDVLDLLDFLSGWFFLDPSTDIDNSGTVDVLDLLDFLSCWFPASNGDPCT